MSRESREGSRPNDCDSLFGPDHSVRGVPLAQIRSDFAKGLPEISFDIEGGIISGQDGCNRFTGKMEVQGNGIRFSPIAGTRMACPGNKKEYDFVS